LLVELTRCAGTSVALATLGVSVALATSFIDTLATEVAILTEAPLVLLVATLVALEVFTALAVAIGVDLFDIVIWILGEKND